MKIIECEQKSPDWFSARCGVPSASNFDKIVDSSGKPSKQRQKYLYQLAGERITGKAEETFQNLAMKRGSETEAEARAFYEMVNGVEVKQVGFCITEGKAIYGCSPDGFVGEEGILEIKCPFMSTQVSYLLANIFPTEYFQQVQGQLLVTGRKWLDFLAYYPAMKPLLIRVVPDRKFQAILATELEVFCKDLDELVKKIGG